MRKSLLKKNQTNQVVQTLI